MWTRERADAWMRGHLKEPFTHTDLMREAAHDPDVGHWSGGNAIMVALQRHKLVHRTGIGKRPNVFRYWFGKPPDDIGHVAKRVALTTRLTFADAWRDLNTLVARGATLTEAETILTKERPMASGPIDMLTEAPTCRRLKDKVITTEDWLAIHRLHGDLTTEDAGHPSGTWRKLVCECGAKHLTC